GVNDDLDLTGLEHLVQPVVHGPAHESHTQRHSVPPQDEVGDQRHPTRTARPPLLRPVVVRPVELARAERGLAAGVRYSFTRAASYLSRRMTRRSWPAAAASRQPCSNTSTPTTETTGTYGDGLGCST